MDVLFNNVVVGKSKTTLGRGGQPPIAEDFYPLFTTSRAAGVNNFPIQSPHKHYTDVEPACPGGSIVFGDQSCKYYTSFASYKFTYDRIGRVELLKSCTTTLKVAFGVIHERSAYDITESLNTYTEAVIDGVRYVIDSVDAEEDGVSLSLSNQDLIPAATFVVPECTQVTRKLSAERTSYSGHGSGSLTKDTYTFSVFGPLMCSKVSYNGDEYPVDSIAFDGTLSNVTFHRYRQYSYN